MPALHFDILPDGRVALVDSTTDDSELWREGAQPRHLTRPIPPPRTALVDRRREVERRRTRAAESPRRGTPLGPQGSADQMLDALEYWPVRSVIAGLRAGPGGTIWAERLATDDRPSPIDVWNAEGGVTSLWWRAQI
jgi:hypothetical protein